MSELEARLDFQIQAARLPAPEREYRFAAMHVGDGPGITKRLKAAGLKNWRFDFAWPDIKFAVEVDGGNWVGGRHTRGAGFEADCLKYHHAILQGWLVYRCTAKLVNEGMALRVIEKLLGGENAQ